MGRVLTNSTGLRVAVEASTGVLPTTPIWTVVEFENIGAYGAIITTVARRPISQDRGRKKGTVTDLDSTVEFETDLTVDAFSLFIEGFMFSEFANVEFDLKSGTATLPPPATGTGYTIDAASALLAGKIVYAGAGAQTLVFAQGYLLAANNGMKVLTADVAAAGTLVTVSGLSAETPPTNASLQVAGVRTDDVTVVINANGTGTLTSGGDVDWTVLGVQVGQLMHIGGVDTDDTATNTPTLNDVDTTSAFGTVRITALTTTVVTFDKAATNRNPTTKALITGTSAGTETVDFLFGRFCRNVAVTAAADDSRYLERTYQFEASYPGLASNGTDTEYEYAVGNFANELGFNLPLTNKATVNFGFIGTNSDDITGTRKTGASTARSPLRTTAFNTSVDLASISTDLISSISDVCFKSMTLTFLNNVSPEKCLGTLGAVFVNAGLFEFNLEGQLLFTSREIVNAIKNNTTVTFQVVLRNDNGAIGIDVPEMTLGGGGREFPVDQSVLVNVTGNTFTSAAFGYDVGISLFPKVPLAA